MFSLGRSLSDAIPDLEEFLHDPATYLRTAPLAIGPAAWLSVAAWFALPGLLVVLAAFLPEKMDWWRLGVGTGLMLLGLPWLILALRHRGRELVLHAEGIEVVAGGHRVFAPWAVFRMPHRLVTRDVGGVVLPVDPARLESIEQRQGTTVLARGKAARVRGWTWLADDEVKLGGEFEIRSGDLVDLLRLLAQRLGDAPLPTTTAPPVALDLRGWFVVPVNALRLPQCCAGCTGPRDRVLVEPILARGEWRATPEHPRLVVPLCEKCHRAISTRQRLGGLVGALVGLALGFPWGLIVAAPLLIVGSVVGFLWSRRLPVRLRRYSPTRGVVSVSFAHPLIALQTLEPLRHRLPEVGSS